MVRVRLFIRRGGDSQVSYDSQREYTQVFVFLPQRLPTTSAFYSTSGLRCSEFALLLDALVGDVHTPVIDVLQSSSVV